MNFVNKFFLIAAMMLSSVAFVPRFVARSTIIGRSISLSASPKEQAESAIATNTVMVFSKTYCPYCTKAKEALSGLNVKFGLLELDVINDGDAIQSALSDLTGQRTVPNIFIKGKHLGGCDKTLAAIASGELQKLLAA